ncbi:hypothetical protein LWI29_031794 [Acer saccharum]|uniref:Cytochrome P450 n=1 Tax=Acer saccharum TaxID=4024 RepID=A0AA39RKJ2_ACESA|nr:hypothetical protein LWI29_031794 [Acer saccharum]
MVGNILERGLDWLWDNPEEKVARWGLGELAIGDHLKAERETNDEEDIIDVMLKIVRNQKTSEARFTEVHIKAILMDIFLAGVDTSAKTVFANLGSSAASPDPSASSPEKDQGS